MLKFLATKKNWEVKFTKCGIKQSSEKKIMGKALAIYTNSPTY